MAEKAQKYRAIIVGSGFSGIAMAIKLKEKGIEDFIILEKSSSLGGTWRDNTYPGAECDIPSALYSYSFAPYPEWEYKWSMQPQILDYIHHVANSYDIQKHIEYNSTVDRLKWNDNDGEWIIHTREGKTYLSQSVVMAVGQLHHPKIPHIEGQGAFNGNSFHSARWSHDLSLSGKKVGVIGNAASAVQFIPEVAKKAEALTIFQRSANWMLPKQDRAYKEWEKGLVRKFPILLRLYRLRIWLLGGALFFLMKKGNGILRILYQKKPLISSRSTLMILK